MNKQRKPKSKIRVKQRQSSPGEVEIDTAKNSRMAGNQFHPMNNDFENEHMTD
jgi:hypothetical protein